MSEDRFPKAFAKRRDPRMLNHHPYMALIVSWSLHLTGACNYGGWGERSGESGRELESD